MKQKDVLLYMVNRIGIIKKIEDDNVIYAYNKPKIRLTLPRGRLIRVTWLLQVQI
jgi:hypothetical protein